MTLGLLRPAAEYNRNIIVWGDHSSILNSGVLAYTAKVIFSDSIYFTDEEILRKTGKEINVQSVVEQPEIYIFAHCSDKISEKLSYVPFRREDILEMSFPLKIEGVVIKDTMKFFQDMYLLEGNLYKCCLLYTSPSPRDRG